MANLLWLGLKINFAELQNLRFSHFKSYHVFLHLLFKPFFSWKLRLHAVSGRILYQTVDNLFTIGTLLFHFIDLCLLQKLLRCVVCDISIITFHFKVLDGYALALFGFLLLAGLFTLCRLLVIFLLSCVRVDPKKEVFYQFTMVCYFSKLTSFGIKNLKEGPKLLPYYLFNIYVAPVVSYWLIFSHFENSLGARVVF